MYPQMSPAKSLRVLLELRPALGGHAGIPQATRLLFRNLSLLDDLQVEGLFQSANRVLRPGLPLRSRRFFGPRPIHWQLNRLGRAVIAIEEGIWNSHVHATAHTILMAVNHML